MEYLSSMYIDNELDLDDKIEFVHKIRQDADFTHETIDLLAQEKVLRSDVVYPIPFVPKTPGWDWRTFLVSLFRPVGFSTAGFALAVVFILLVMPVGENEAVTNRFVIYMPGVQQAEITGTFTDWKRLPMEKIGSSGYWEIVLNLPRGEHRFTYILEGQKQIADPTILAREKDDFGGENSIIIVKGKA
jgi:hypothetical protein